MLRQYELVERVKAYEPDADEAILNRAYVYTVQKHGTQQRASGDPYFSHPIEVAGLMTELKLDQQRMKAMATCIEKSNSCGEAAGCAAGTGFNAAVDQAKDFLKGMQRALDNK